MAFTSLSNIAPFERLWVIRQPRNIILRNTRATIVLGGSQFTRCIPLSKREAKIKNQAGFFVFDKFTLQVNLGDESGVNPFKHTFSHHLSRKQYYEALFFIMQTSDRICSFLPCLKLILQFFTILQEKLHSFNIQDDQSTRFAFLCTTNYSIYHIIKRFHEENTIMLGLFN